FWQTEFGGAADIIGRKVLINQHPMTIVGVAAAAFHGVDIGAVPALWIPASMYAQAIPGAEDLLRSPRFWMQILARLRPDFTPPQAQAGLQPWFKAWLQDNMLRPGFPIISADRRREYLASTLAITSAPQGHSPLRRGLSQPLWLLFAATGVLLGLACLNVAGLFLAHGSARGREIGTRLALGASRGRIGRQLLTDSLLLALAGGVLGVAVAPFAIRALIAFLPQDLAPSALRGTLSLRLLAFTFFASLIAGLLSGLALALHAAGDSGRLIDRIHDAVRVLPVTRGSGIARNELLTGGAWNGDITIQTDRRFTTDRLVNLNAVSPGFFATLSVRLLAGRDFDQR